MVLTRRFRFPFSMIKRGLEYNIPYTFGGVPSLKEIFCEESNMEVSKIMAKPLPDLQQGFLYAYENILEALACQDLEYLKKNLEGRFFDAISGYPQNLAEKKEEIIYKNLGENEILLKQMCLIMGADIERNNNPKLYKNEYRFFDYMKFKVYSENETRKKNIFFTIWQTESSKMPILQLYTIFKSRKKLFLKSDPEQIENAPEVEYHKILFERVCDGISFDKLSLRSFYRDPNNKFKHFFKDSMWKISDFDDFMKGNEFSS